MSRALWAVLCWLVSATDLWAIDFTRYHTQEEINGYLKEVATTHPELAHMHFLGYSQRGGLKPVDITVALPRSAMTMNERILSTPLPAGGTVRVRRRRCRPCLS